MLKLYYRMKQAVLCRSILGKILKILCQVVSCCYLALHSWWKGRLGSLCNSVIEWLAQYVTVPSWRTYPKRSLLEIQVSTYYKKAGQRLMLRFHPLYCSETQREATSKVRFLVKGKMKIALLLSPIKNIIFVFVNAWYISKLLECCPGQE